MRGTGGRGYAYNFGTLDVEDEESDEGYGSEDQGICLTSDGAAKYFRRLLSLAYD
jgi:hypothetical protein